MSEGSHPVSCSRCGTPSRADAKFCGGCGRALGSELPCPSCGTPNRPRSRFCDECGQALRSTTHSPGPEAAARARALPETLGGGRYRVLRFLGEGGRKRVYLAEDGQLGREVAISTFKASGLDERAVARARREAQAMARLSDHPNIVPIYDIGEQDGELYLVSQYMAGGDLEQMLVQAEGRRLTVEEAVRIAIEIARALEHAHANDIIHRDVKPANVWLGPDGTVKLGDFGLARALDTSRLTAEGATVGTVAYMSPEQALGQSAEARSDLYSLGAVAYEMLCGFPPFVGEDAASVISQHAGRVPVGPTWHRQDVPRALEQVVLRLLAKAPNDRPASAAEVQRALEAITTSSLEEGPAEEDALERLSEGSFFGRAAELRELRGAADEALAGRGGVTMIVGEQGIGKSRLAGEVETYAQLRDATVLWGRCTEREGAPAYWPWVQAIRSYVRGIDPDELRAELGPGASDVAQVVSEVRERIPELDEPRSLDLEQARFRLFDSITTLLLNASQRTPLLIVLDDLHQADRSSLLLLEFIARELATARILLLGTYRDGDLDPDHPLLEVHSSLSRERGYRRLRLGGLSEREVKELIEHIARQTMSTPEELALVSAILQESDGNPYFTEEILRHLIETGVVYRSEDRWVSEVRRIEDLGIPQGIIDAVTRRIDRLSAECRESLEVAAIVGRRFSLGVLEALTGSEAATLMEYLQEAMDGGVLEAVSDEIGGYQFAHAATRDALYRSLPSGRRAELHQRVGEALEELYESRIEAHLGELAHHFAEATPIGGAEKAAEYSWWAGERATQQCAYDEGVSHYRRAISLFDATGDDPTRRCELLLALGDALWRAGEGPEAERTFDQASELAKRLSLPEQYARAALGYGGGPGGFSVANRANERLVELLRSALELLPERDSVLRVRLIARLAIEMRLYADGPDADQSSREAVEMADRIGDARILLLARYSREWAVMGPDDVDDRRQAGEEIVRVARIVEDREMEFRGQHLRLIALLQGGDLAGVDSVIRACGRLAKELRQPRYEWQETVFRAMRALLQGRFKEGMRLAEAALAIGQRGVGEVAIVSYGAQAFIGHWAEGRLEELREAGEGFVERYPSSAWPSGFTWLLCEIGELDEARRRFDAIRSEGFDAIPRDADWLAAIATLCLTAHHLGEVEAAERLYELLLPYAEEMIPIVSGAGSLGSAQLFLAHAAHAAGRLDDAIGHYRQALERSAGNGVRIQAPRGYLRLAEALLEQGEQARAIEAVDRGLEEASALGTALEAERLTELRFARTPLAGADARTSIELVAESVELSRPDLAPAAAPDGTVTLMFSDIEDSTRLNETLGDRAWLELLREHNAIVRDAVSGDGGYEVKSIGDGFMLAFSSARNAVHCAIEIQRRLHERRQRPDIIPLRVRIGLHTGEALRTEEEDFHGTNVNLAARVAELAGGGEILASSVLHDLVVGTGEFDFSAEREVELKGLRGRHRVYEVPWLTEVAKADA